MYRANNTLNILSESFIIYSLMRAIYGLIFILLLVFYYSTKITLGVLLSLLYKRPVSIDRRYLLKHWSYDNFELNWFHGLSKSPAITFSQVSANSFRFNIQKCSRSLYAFIAFRPTCFAWRLVMRNLHETSTHRARSLYPHSKNNSRRITYGIGCVWGMPSLSPLSSLDSGYWSVVLENWNDWRKVKVKINLKTLCFGGWLDLSLQHKTKLDQSKTSNSIPACDQERIKGTEKASPIHTLFHR